MSVLGAPQNIPRAIVLTLGNTEAVLYCMSSAAIWLGLFNRLNSTPGRQAKKNRHQLNQALRRLRP